MSKEAALKDALLEIYTEEIPASFLPPALEQAKELAEKNLAENRLTFKSVKTYATPRRIAVIIEGLPEKTDDEKQEIIGPNEKIAFDENKKPTKAALGFLKSNAAPPEDLKVVETPRGRYACIVKVTPGTDASKILPGVFEKIITGLNFRKNMTWEPTKFRFARPIRNILAIFGSRPLKMSLAGLKANAATYGLYVLTSKKIKITEPQKYLVVLRNNYIIADHVRRREIIRELSEQALKNILGKQSPEILHFGEQALKKILKLKPVAGLTESLLDEINFLIESPVAVLCSFDEKYLGLPREILDNCIKKQKFIPVYSGDELTNHFIGIRNGISEHQDIVREGYQRVLSARLADASCFYKHDSSVMLEDRVQKLAGVMFQEKIGTMLEKVNRIAEISVWLAGSLRHSYPGINEETMRGIDRTANLCKADLLTKVVYEYPELQGTAGRLYAALTGEKEEVARGIEEHLWPLTGQGELPSTVTGIIVSLADKMDTLAGDFAAGLIPTGSADPYALRRQAAGILRIIIEKNADINLRKLANKAIELLPTSITQDKVKIIELLFDFFKQRFETLLEDKGFSFDEIRAVLVCGFDNPIDALKRIEAIASVRKMSDFEPLLIGYKRAANIVKQAEQKKFDSNANGAVDESKLAEPEEKALYEKVTSVEKETAPLLQAKDYKEVLSRLVALRSAIDLFFDKVMVMAEDSSVRSNRLSLLKRIVNLFLKVGDISILQ
jgi:glycyl-tRNA synthetase beta chain